MTVGKAIKYYQNLGYDCGYRTVIKINQNDINPNSKAKVEVICDYCGEHFTASRIDLNRGRISKHACKKCSYKKNKEGNIHKYGVEHTLQLKDVINKRKETCMRKYGVDNPMKNPETVEKVKNTVREKYNVDSIFQSDEVRKKCVESLLKHYGVTNPQKSKIIQEKTQKTCLMRYGVTNPIKSKEIQERIRQKNITNYGVPYANLSVPEIKERYNATMLSKYGTIYPSQISEFKEKAKESAKKTNLLKYGTVYPQQSPIIKEKMRLSFLNRDNACVYCSKNQRYLANLFNGEINVRKSFYFVDIFFDKEQIYCEYDGGGHDLQVKLGELTEKEFIQKEYIRYKQLKKEGLKLLRIKHINKKLPSDNLLLLFKDFSFEILKTTDCNWITIDLDKHLIFTKTFKLTY